jgi:protein-tyrosine phosphatase
VSATVVDCHSHVLFGVDDGARTLEQAVAMLDEARAAGTRILFATPHIAPPYQGWTGSAARLERIRRRFAELEAHVPEGLELRLGFEITPVPHRLRADDDPARFRLPGTEVVLIDGPQAVPWVGDAAMERYVQRVRAEGLTPVLAHPERRAAWPGPHDSRFAERMRTAGALLQVDASGLSGADGPGTAEEARRLLTEGLVDLIASDGHGSPGSPVRLDEAVRAAAEVVGDRAAARLVDGSALGLRL